MVHFSVHTAPCLPTLCSDRWGCILSRDRAFRRFFATVPKLVRPFQLLMAATAAAARGPPMYAAARRVVVTGIGLVTPLGVGVHPVWSRLLDGACGVTTLPDRFAGLPSQVAGEKNAALTRHPPRWACDGTVILPLRVPKPTRISSGGHDSRVPLFQFRLGMWPCWRSCVRASWTRLQRPPTFV